MSGVLSVFDDEEENKLSYTEIHQQYKQLVSSSTALSTADIKQMYRNNVKVISLTQTLW